ncbi:MAG: Flp pilus assembly protein CpaB [Elusimicrobia bacterium CG_4_8_14_3_um_filter_50_9]|nr:MAG: Flp pilus assembly protein CpaB [Elusimicrobia bacterium CG_4_8_14_3_um_filter_50_9]
MQNRKVILIAAVFGVMAVLLVQAFLSNVENKYKVGAELINVLVAKGYISEGTLVTEYMVDTKRIPRNYVQPGAVTTVRQLMNEQGMYVNATLVPILEGEQVTSTKLVQPGKETGMSIVIPEGYRAVSIAITDVTGVARLIKPGDRVDVIGTSEFVMKHRPMVRSFTAFQNILVLAYNQNIMGTVIAPEKKSEQGMGMGELSQEDKHEQIPTVTLALTPDQAQKITHLAKIGEIQLSLRPIGEKATPSLSVIDTDDLLKN